MEVTKEDVVEASEHISAGLNELLIMLDDEDGEFPATYNDLLYFFPLRALSCPYCVAVKRLPGTPCIPNCEFAMSHGGLDCDNQDSVWWRLAVTSLSNDIYYTKSVSNQAKIGLRELCKCGFPIFTDVDQFMVAKKQLLKSMIEFFPENEESLKVLEEY